MKGSRLLQRASIGALTCAVRTRHPCKLAPGLREVGCCSAPALKGFACVVRMRHSHELRPPVSFMNTAHSATQVSCGLWCLLSMLHACPLRCAEPVHSAGVSLKMVAKSSMRAQVAQAFGSEVHTVRVPGQAPNVIVATVKAATRGGARASPGSGVRGFSGRALRRAARQVGRAAGFGFDAGAALEGVFRIERQPRCQDGFGETKV